MERIITEEALKDEIGRRTRRELDAGAFSPAAVMIPILINGGPPRLVLMVRSAEVEHHKNQISFPGGRLDGSATSWEAALRETQEEVSIDPSSVRLVGQLDDIYTITKFRVTPFVGWVEKEVRLVGSPHEASLLLEPPIHELMDPAIHREERTSWGDKPVMVHFYSWRSHVIWGATGLILHQFLEICERAMG
jgi:8-oxo-dGTP pyrophosphatase MutT (NUDIX family)